MSGWNHVILEIGFVAEERVFGGGGDVKEGPEMREGVEWSGENRSLISGSVVFFEA